MKVQAIIPAAGLGTRFKKATPKSLFKIYGKPLFIHTLEAFEKSPQITSIIVVSHPQYLSEFSKAVLKFSLKKVTLIIAGGANRTESIGKGLVATDDDTKIVVIHDAARPFVTPRLIGQAINDCKKHHAVVVGIPVKSTIKRINVRKGRVAETLNRSELWEIQTPQVFKKNILLKAYDHFKKQSKKSKVSLTDDASLVERMGIPVKVCLGSPRNIKITTPEDLALAEFYFHSKR